MRSTTGSKQKKVGGRRGVTSGEMSGIVIKTPESAGLMNNLLYHRAGAPQRKRRDECDEEYDRGKQKKVKGAQGHDKWEDGGNRFQDAWNSRQHSGGSHHKQVGSRE